MKKSDYGRKHTCPECTCKYYDLKNKTPACPKCGTKAPREPVLKSVRRR